MKDTHGSLDAAEGCQRALTFVSSLEAQAKQGGGYSIFQPHMVTDIDALSNYFRASGNERIAGEFRSLAGVLRSGQQKVKRNPSAKKKFYEILLKNISAVKTALNEVSQEPDSGTK
ncbi:MAG: hypothetical protein LBJ77_03640 [Holosporales bacterium]|nr:hypothetical protein [Holosporales bacterium]